MRAVVLILALLAGLKIWAHQHMQRAGMEEAVIAAYRARAIAACQKDAALSLKGAPATAGAWGAPGSVKLSIGKRGLDVAIWDVDNAQWPARFKQPYLRLTTADRSVVCEYDVTLEQAEVVRL